MNKEYILDRVELLPPASGSLTWAESPRLSAGHLVAKTRCIVDEGGQSHEELDCYIIRKNAQIPSCIPTGAYSVEAVGRIQGVTLVVNGKTGAKHVAVADYASLEFSKDDEHAEPEPAKPAAKDEASTLIAEYAAMAKRVHVALGTGYAPDSPLVALIVRELMEGGAK